MTSTDGSPCGSGALPGSALMMIGSPTNGFLATDGRELGAEFAVAQVQRPLVDQPERRGIPERRRPAVAQHHLVAVGHREELAQPVAHPADQIFHRRLPVRRAEKRGGAGGKSLQLFGSDLRRAGSKASVAGFDVVGDRELVSHAHQVSDPAEADIRR